MDQVTMTNFDLNDAYAELSVRIDAAHIRYGGFASTHEALGVALEEWNELVQAIQSNDIQSVSSECLDLAAVLIRLSSAIRRGKGLIQRSGK